MLIGIDDARRDAEHKVRRPVKIEHKSEAFNTGFEAHEQNEPRDANPYGKDTWSRDEWFRGWDEAAS